MCLGLLTKIPRAFHKLGGAAKRWWTKHGQADLQALSRLDANEILDRLPMFWANDLRDQLAVTGERVVLFLDTYEAQRRALAEAFYHGQQVLERQDFIVWYRRVDDAFQQAAQWRLSIPLQEALTGFVEEEYGAGHEQTGYALNNLADLYQNQARYEEAEPLYQRSLEIFEQRLGVDHPNTRTVRGNYERFLRERSEASE